MLRLLITIILSIGLVSAQKMVTKSITIAEDDHDRLIKIVTHKQDSTMKIIIDRDGEIEELVLPLDGLHSRKIQDKLAQYDIALDDFNWQKLADFDCDVEPSAWLGVQIQSLTDQLRLYFGIKHDGGVLVSEVIKDGPAEKAGLKAGDIIMKIDDTNISDTDELQKVIRGYDPETQVTIQFIRDHKEKKQKITLGETEGLGGMPLFEDHFKYRYPRFKGGKFCSPGDEHFEKYMFRIPDEEGKHQRFRFYSDDDDLEEAVEELKKELEALKAEMKKLTQ
ncbi:MAG: PDZ domain-containing protein [Candidatus Marinimicrobia bacterium]|nr:PDZ domain-containing protein [Candidatus Neomarinimicrobiota bacterium]